MRQGLGNFLSLFTSTGTLLCCALPSLLVALGAGAALAALWTLPGAGWLIDLSQYKAYFFVIAGAMIGFNGMLIHRPSGRVACAVNGGKACEQANRFNKFMFWLSVMLWTLGLFGAYLVLPLRQTLGL